MADYDVCKDLINETIDIFDTPRFFHLGMDEETYDHQRHFLYTVVRQYDLWWQDLYFLVEQVEKRGVRAWVWSDKLWREEEFLKKMPKTVIQSNWYYGDFKRVDNEITKRQIEAYIKLEENGYKQIPTGSIYEEVWDNFPLTVEFCRKHISDENLLGFLQTAWVPTMERYEKEHFKAIESLKKGKEIFIKKEEG